MDENPRIPFIEEEFPKECRSPEIVTRFSRDSTVNHGKKVLTRELPIVEHLVSCWGIFTGFTQGLHYGRSSNC